MSAPPPEFCAAAQRAGAYFGDSFHCAEAVAKAVLEALGHDPDPVVACATPFGGGFGKSFQEACGALSGALLVAGHLHGRSAAGQDWDYAASLGALLRQGFVERHGTTRCAALRERFGPQRQMAECRNVVRAATCDLLQALDLPLAAPADRASLEVAP
jgi:C_GCAxxG_C_C family probable redox protein